MKPNADNKPRRWIVEQPTENEGHLVWMPLPIESANKSQAPSHSGADPGKTCDRADVPDKGHVPNSRKDVPDLGNSENSVYTLDSAIYKQAINSAKAAYKVAEVYAERIALLEEQLSYLPKVPTEPYEQAMAKRIGKLERALNRIAILGMGELAYTSEFTERVNMIVRDVLKSEK